MNDQYFQPPAADTDYLQPCIDYLATYSSTPEAYILAQFDHRDVVLLAEDHAIRHNLLLAQRLVPLLHQVGVYNFGMEFGASEDQPALDALVGFSGPAGDYNEDRARHLMFNYNVGWAYREYTDIYRAAWTLNHSLPKNAPRFRVLNLSYRYDWRGFNGILTPERVRHVFHKGGTEAYRARIVEREIIERGEKILILTGTIHAFTRFAMPVFDYNAPDFVRFDDRHLGNLIDRMAPGRSATILLHQPFPSRRDGPVELVQPAGGAIERIMSALDNPRTGFSLAGTPLGDLPDDSFYATGNPDFRLRDLADGYIFEMPFRAYEGCTVDEAYPVAENWAEVQAQWPDPNWHPRPGSPADYWRRVRTYADLARRYASMTDIR